MKQHEVTVPQIGLIAASVEPSSAITPTSPLAPTMCSTPFGPTATTSRLWCGFTGSSSYRHRFTSRTSSQAAGVSETHLEELLTKGHLRVALLALGAPGSCQYIGV